MDNAAQALALLMQHLQSASEAKKLPGYKKALGEAAEALDDLGAFIAELYNNATTVDNEGMPIVHAITHDADTGRFNFDVEL